MVGYYQKCLWFKYDSVLHCQRKKNMEKDRVVICFVSRKSSESRKCLHTLKNNGNKKGYVADLLDLTFKKGPYKLSSSS